MASALRERLVRAGRTVHLLDIQPVTALRPGESSAVVELGDIDALIDAFQGADAVLHFGGHPTEQAWADILHTNIDGTHNVLEGARVAGVPSVLLASSIHAVGYRRTDEVADEPVPSPRPDSYYGVGKVAMEALGSLYADRCGLRVLSLRIANFADAPDRRRGLSFWFSPDDLTRAVEAFLQDGTPGHRIAWGVSANTRRTLDLSAGAAFGFHPQDDAEQFADAVPDTVEAWDDLLAGGFLAPGRELGTPF